MNQGKKVSFRVKDNQYIKLQKKLAESNSAMSDYIRQLIENDLNSGNSSTMDTTDMYVSKNLNQIKKELIILTHNIEKVQGKKSKEYLKEGVERIWHLLN